MILSALKSYLHEKKQASLKDIAAKFDTSETALEGMLAHWERKGLIKKRQEAASCENACGHKCSTCPMQCTQIYEWTQND